MFNNQSYKVLAKKKKPDTEFSPMTVHHQNQVIEYFVTTEYTTPQ